MRNSVCDTQKEIQGEKQNKKQRASSGGKSECCRGIPDQPMGKRKEKKRQNKTSLRKQGPDCGGKGKRIDGCVQDQLFFFVLSFFFFSPPSFSCSFQRIGLPSNIQTHNSKCFVYVQIFLGGFLPPFLSLPAGHRINISLPSYDYVCVCVRAAIVVVKRRPGNAQDLSSGFIDPHQSLRLLFSSPSFFFSLFFFLFLSLHFLPKGIAAFLVPLSLQTLDNQPNQSKDDYTK